MLDLHNPGRSLEATGKKGDRPERDAARLILKSAPSALNAA
jgi:hypothetical protein